MADSFVEALEWTVLVQRAREQARSEAAKELLRHFENPLHWAKSVSEAQLWQRHGMEVVDLLRRDGLWVPLNDLEDPGSALEILNQRRVCSVEELCVLRGWLLAMDSWFSTPTETFSSSDFAKDLKELLDPSALLRTLARVMTPEGEISERASPRLHSISSRISELQSAIERTLAEVVGRYQEAGALQDGFSDLRDGRYVVPVKIAHRSAVPGRVFEASVSRQTVYVEPREVEVLNTELQNLEAERVEEVYRILKEVSEELAPFHGEFQKGTKILIYWDSVQARVRLASIYGGRPIEVTQERVVELEDSAHPLLWWSVRREEIVRNAIRLDSESRAVLITGPNTGGKTVFLKTIGLAAIAARTGFFFPGQVVRVGFFDRVFIDLGDLQSIEEHLSSFSGHVMVLKSILESLTSQSLILLDELNSSTDPEEGAALSRAVLEKVLDDSQAMIVATTHDPVLKSLAVEDSRILNASMQFDDRQLTPTYRLVLGVPGRSRALEVAEKLGLGSEVLDRARSFLTDQHRRFETLLASLEEERGRANQARARAEQDQQQAAQLKEQWAEKTRVTMTEVLGTVRARLRRITQAAQSEARETLRTFREKGGAIEKTQAALKSAFESSDSAVDQAVREELEVRLGAESAGLIHKERESPPSRVRVGSRVRVPKWRTTGEVVEWVGNRIKVDTGGAMQLMLQVDEVEEIEGESNRSGAQKNRVSWDTELGDQVGVELDLRGQRFEEAMEALELYLDRAFRQRLLSVRVIHGLGTGALREGTKKIVGKLNYVARSRDGGPGEGGAGVTVVEFDLS